MVIKWKSDFDKFVVVSNFNKRSWVQVETDEWDIYWANVGQVKSIFSSESNLRLRPGQLVNHFPNHYELTRKDLMVKNIKRYQKQLKKEGKETECLDFIPTTYVLPQDYALFVEEFRKNANSTWIMKPTAKAQGKGIFLINKLSQVRKWSNGLVPSISSKAQLENYVVSRYIDNPLLIGGKKFDLRLYVVVVSYKPLQVYMSELGFGRFCNMKYNTEVAEIDNMFIHLTNVAIQKHGEDYNAEHGNKWSLSNLKLYLEGVRGYEPTQHLMMDIEALIVNSLKSCQGVIINDRHCFELYGYDVMIDENLKPWLIEVNASPSLTTTTNTDRLMKLKVIADTIDIVTPKEWVKGASAQSKAADSQRRMPVKVGSMTLLYDEAVEIEQERASRRGSHVPENSRGVRGRATMLDYFDRPKSAF